MRRTVHSFYKKLITRLSALKNSFPGMSKSVPSGQKPRESEEMNKALVAFYSQLIQKGDCCFDIGANIGNRTDIFLSLGARVVCVEPQPACVSSLKRKYKKDDRVIIVPKGVAQEPATGTLFICNSASTISTFSDQWKTGRFRTYRWDSTMEVPMTTLDELIREHGIPAFCKIDVEGYELQVIKGLSSPVTLSFEFTSEFIDDAKASLDHLAAIGPYRVNLMIGETPELTFAEWTDVPTLLETIAQMDQDLLWGDILVKFD